MLVLKRIILLNNDICVIWCQEHVSHILIDTRFMMYDKIYKVWWGWTLFIFTQEAKNNVCDANVG